MITWGLLGTGFISETVAEAIAGSPGSTIGAVAGRSTERVADFQRRHGVPHGTVDPAEICSDPSIDVIYIGLPNHRHLDATVAASAAGKAVLSEKSLTTSMVDANALVDAVQANGTFFVEGLMYLAHPAIRRFVEVLADGRLGEVLSVSGRYAAAIDDVVNPEGGGTLYNLGCYPASLLHLVMQVTGGDDAFGSRSLVGVGHRSSARGAIHSAAAAIRFENGVLATLQSSDTFGLGSEFAVSGRHGVLRFETNPWLPVAGDNVIVWQPYEVDHDRPEETIVISDDHDAFHHQVVMVERALGEGRTEALRPSPRLGDSLEIMGLLTEWEAACGR